MKKIEDIQKLTIDELKEIMRESEFDTRAREIVSTEINARLLKVAATPHWSLTPLFWVSVVAAVAACIAAYPVVFPSQERKLAPVVPQTQNDTAKSQPLSIPPPIAPPASNKRAPS